MTDKINPALGTEWFPSRWGANDERGAGNLLGPHKVLQARDLIRTGETVSLGFPYRVGMPLSPGRTFGLKMPGGPTGGPEGAVSRTIWNDDFICTEIGQIGTHMDALGHLGHQVTYPCGHCDTLVYNGNKLSEIWSPYGLKKLGIEKAPIFFTRAVLLDVQGLFGRPLENGFVITPDHLRQCLVRQGMNPDDWLSQGDVVLIRTGHGSRFFSEAETWYDGEPGLGLEAAEYLSALQPVIVGADNFAIDVVPPVDPDIVLPCHQHLIMRHGIYLHEGMNLDPIAETGRYEFVYGFAPLAIEGATGSPGTPFAIL
ncbi:cyclase family protein [Shinella sedimenti]|uniref:Cyclase family protein n=1 Tax=Shinella sedimenti TaxID=2919913 RepID=A0ABT0CRQ6_9HYPH|nr:cyclase family protein [Shinella sedimenti]MCJ8151271.1 cyclase family protein [Shinella sedimenti]